MNKVEERIKTKTLDNNLKMCINVKLWASACLMKVLYMSFAVALVATGLDINRVGAFAFLTLIFMYLDARYLCEERLLRSRGDVAMFDCITSWSVLPYYLSIWVTLALLGVKI